MGSRTKATVDPTDKKPANFKDLLVWQQGMKIAAVTYQLTRLFPRDERFGIVSQMRRAAVSVPSNLAEGQARATTAQFVHFISQAEGSLAELETQVRLSISLGYCSEDDATGLLRLLESQRKMLNALRRSLSGRL
jgi:four helix bundle protein